MAALAAAESASSSMSDSCVVALATQLDTVGSTAWPGGPAPIAISRRASRVGCSFVGDGSHRRVWSARSPVGRTASGRGTPLARMPAMVMPMAVAASPTIATMPVGVVWNPWYPTGTAVATKARPPAIATQPDHFGRLLDTGQVGRRSRPWRRPGGGGDGEVPAQERFRSSHIWVGAGGGEQVSHLTRVGVQLYIFALHRGDLAGQQYLRRVPRPERDDEQAQREDILCGPRAPPTLGAVVLHHVHTADRRRDRRPRHEGPLTFSPSTPGHRPARAQRPTEHRPDDSPGTRAGPSSSPCPVTLAAGPRHR
jgi:hypothetical protein